MGRWTTDRANRRTNQVGRIGGRKSHPTGYSKYSLGESADGPGRANRRCPSRSSRATVTGPGSSALSALTGYSAVHACMHACVHTTAWSAAHATHPFAHPLAIMRRAQSKAHPSWNRPESRDSLTRPGYARRQLRHSTGAWNHACISVGATRPAVSSFPPLSVRRQTAACAGRSRAAPRSARAATCGAQGKPADGSRTLRGYSKYSLGGPADGSRTAPCRFARGVVSGH